MMNYNKPGQVRSPRGYTKHIKPLFDGGEEGYSIAILENCEGNHNIGVRWNVSEKEWDDTRKTEKETSARAFFNSPNFVKKSPFN